MCNASKIRSQLCILYRPTSQTKSQAQVALKSKAKSCRYELANQQGNSWRALNRAERRTEGALNTAAAAQLDCGRADQQAVSIAADIQGLELLVKEVSDASTYFSHGATAVKANPASFFDSLKGNQSVDDSELNQCKGMAEGMVNAMTAIAARVLPTPETEQDDSADAAMKDSSAGRAPQMKRLSQQEPALEEEEEEEEEANPILDMGFTKLVQRHLNM